jgi:hypothetical protein
MKVQSEWTVGRRVGDEALTAAGFVDGGGADVDALIEFEDACE